MAILAFQKPDKVIMLEGTDTVGRFEFRPLEPGYGQTIGNALRRILLTSLTSHLGCLKIGVVELTLKKAIHVSNLLFLLKLDSVLTLFLALCSQTVLSRRIIPLLEILITSEYRLAELTGDLSAWTNISCHSNFCFNSLIRLYDGLLVYIRCAASESHRQSL